MGGLWPVPLVSQVVHAAESDTTAAPESATAMSHSAEVGQRGIHELIEEFGHKTLELASFRDRERNAEELLFPHGILQREPGRCRSPSHWSNQESKSPVEAPY
jgi:hypothetical protein